MKNKVLKKSNICFWISTVLDIVSAPMNALIENDNKNKKAERLASSIQQDLTQNLNNAYDFDVINNYSDMSKVYEGINSIPFGINNNTVLNSYLDQSQSYSFGGMISSLIGSILDSKRNSKISDESIEYKNKYENTQNILESDALRRANDQVNNINQRNLISKLATYSKDGGTINGMNMDNGTTQFDGYKHGQGAYSGIPIGMNAEGGLNVAEGGEVRDNENDYIYSDSFVVSKADQEKYGLSKKYADKTIAECAKLASKESDERGPGDNISKNTKDSILKKLRALNDEKLAEKQLQEQLKAIKENRMDLLQEEMARQAKVEQEKMAQQQALAEQQAQIQSMQGQPIQDPAMQQLDPRLSAQQPQAFGDGGNFRKDAARKRAERITGIDLPNDWDIADYKSAIAQYKQSPEYKEYKSERGQKAGTALNALGSILGPIIGLATTKSPDYTEAENIRNSVTAPTPITPSTVKLVTPEVYKPRYTNIDYFINQANNAYAASLAHLRSQGLTPGQYMAAAANAAQQYYNTIGETMLKGYERNDAERKYALESRNKAIDNTNKQYLTNADIINKANMFNAQQQQAFNNNSLQANVAAANYINSLDTSYSDAISSGITGTLEGIGNFGKLLWDAKTARTPNYQGITQEFTNKKYGGKIRKKIRNKK